MRIALVVTDLQPGGTPLRISRLARRLKAANIDVHVGCLARPGLLSDELRRDGIPTFSADAASSYDFAAIRRLRERIGSIDPDLIHATLTHANVACRWIGRKLKIPVITSTATIEVERPWHVRMESWTQRWDAGHIVNSRAVADHVHQKFGVPRERIFIVPPSIEPWPRKLDCGESRRQLGLCVDTKVILWAGRFDPVKRVDLLIEILPEFPPDSMLMLAGDGAQRTRIEQLVAVRGLRSRVVFLGWQSDLSVALSAADIFAFPSRTEGMPNAVLMAMAAGVPVVASDIAPHRELAGERGRLMLAPDSHLAWVRVISELLGDDSRRAQLALLAKTWAHENLDPERTTAATIKIYERVVASNRRFPI